MNLKRLAISFLSILTFIPGVYGQSKSLKDTCIISTFKDVDIFIPGSVDSIQENGLKVKAIYAADLINGFELKSADSAVKILRFQLVFDNKKEGNLYTKSFKGNKVMNNEEEHFLLSKIGGATLITIEEVSFRYKNACYRAKSQVYLCR